MKTFFSIVLTCIALMFTVPVWAQSSHKAYDLNPNCGLNWQPPVDTTDMVFYRVEYVEELVKETLSYTTPIGDNNVSCAELNITEPGYYDARIRIEGNQTAMPLWVSPWSQVVSFEIRVAGPTPTEVIKFPGIQMFCMSGTLDGMQVAQNCVLMP